MARKRFSTVNSASVDSFAYTAPEQAFAAARILVKPNLIARPEAPAAVSAAVLGSVLRGLRRAAPTARIVIIEAGTADLSAEAVLEQFDIEPLLDQEMRLGDVVQMIPAEYATTEQALTAPEAVQDYDCVVSVAALSAPSNASASLRNLIGLLPPDRYPDREAFATPDGLRTIAEAFGAHIDGSVIQVGDRVVWGSDLQAVDEAASKIGQS